MKPKCINILQSYNKTYNVRIT